MAFSRRLQNHPIAIREQVAWVAEGGRSWSGDIWLGPNMSAKNHEKNSAEREEQWAMCTEAGRQEQSGRAETTADRSRHGLVDGEFHDEARGKPRMHPQGRAGAYCGKREHDCLRCTFPCGQQDWSRDVKGMRVVCSETVSREQARQARVRVDGTVRAKQRQQRQLTTDAIDTYTEGNTMFSGGDASWLENKEKH